MSVGSVCVLGEPWLELLADRFLLLRQPNFSVRPETFLGAGIFCFLNKGRNSTTAISLVHFTPNAYLISRKTIAKLTVLSSNS